MGPLPVGRREGDLSSRRGHGPSVVGVSHLRELPRAASGLWVVVGPWGWLSGVGGRSRATWRGWGARGGWCGLCGVASPVRRRFTVLPSAGGVSWRPAGPARHPPSPPPHASAVPSFPAARPRSEPASRPPPLSPPPVGTGGSRPRPSPCAHPRPGDACPGGDPRDAAASARRCALSPRAVAVPRLAPPSPPLREGVACGGGGGGKGTRGCAVRLSPVLGFGVRARPNPPPPALPRPPLRRAPAPSVP